MRRHQQHQESHTVQKEVGHSAVWEEYCIHTITVIVVHISTLGKELAH